MSEPTRVLLVDDDKAIVRACQLRLRAAGYQTTVAYDGPSALRIVRDAPPDVVVLDIRMPEMDGFEVLSRLQAEQATRSIPVIMLSANVAERAKTQALTQGARLFIEKPYRGEALVEALGQVVAGRPAETASSPQEG
jgi:CheY-like chemotaxis protein